MDKIDVRIGNTAFLKNYWNNVDILVRSYQAGLTQIPSNYGLDYPKATPVSFLEDKIKKLHEKVGNFNIDGKTILVGAGATQLLFAAMYAMKHQKNKYVAVAASPYWFRFKDMAIMSGFQFESYDPKIGTLPFAGGFEILTTPNNPDCETYWSEHEDTIVDACYNWPQYTDQVYYLDSNIAIFSLAKATGHAGTRIGWAFVKESAFANSMAHYIEMTTSGVSVDAQLRAGNIIDSQLFCKERENMSTCFNEGSSVLKYRWKIIKSVLPSEIRALNNSGMFLWGEVDSNRHVTDSAQYLENEFGIIVMGGRPCGGTDKNFRINMGCDDLTFNRMIDSFKKGQK